MILDALGAFAGFALRVTMDVALLLLVLEARDAWDRHQYRRREFDLEMKFATKAGERLLARERKGRTDA